MQSSKNKQLNNQNSDMTKEKAAGKPKLSDCFFLLIFLSFLALSGCELINFLLFEETPPEQTGMLTVLSRENLDNYYSYTSKEVTEANCRTNGEGDLFLIKYNNNNFDIKGSTTGYVTNASRAAEQNICLSNINDESTQFNRIDFRYSEDFLTHNINTNRSAEIINNNIKGVAK